MNLPKFTGITYGLLVGVLGEALGDSGAAVLGFVFHFVAGCVLFASIFYCND